MRNTRAGLASTSSPILVAVVLSLGLSTPTLHARRLIDSVVIRVYDTVRLDAAIRDDAVKTARTILEDAGLNAEWRDCQDAARAAMAPCAGGRGPDDLIIRIMHGGTEVLADPHETLGYSVVETPTGAGALATIYVDRVEKLARRARTDYGALVGRAIAHEVGHLMLGTNEHGPRGLMREVWTDAEIFRNQHDDWVFASRERRQLRSAWLRDGETVSNRENANR